MDRKIAQREDSGERSHKRCSLLPNSTNMSPPRNEKDWLETWSSFGEQWGIGKIKTRIHNIIHLESCQESI